MPIKVSAPKSVLLVCLGNICRSPTAEEVLRQKAAVEGMSLTVDSAGTGDWHIGKHPDDRAIAHAKAYGYAISKLVARQVQPDDFYQFDLILAMDKQNLQDLQAIKDRLINENPEQSETLAKLVLFSEEDPIHAGEDVPDPYYGGDEAFERCIAHIESGANAWIESWKSC
ncbi:low molecular weight protein-tyrosine-phosphatase [Psychrobacter sp. I-STPA10]|uniref:low molecular weight protein-tyrosine-phosphatase n=1 Tax=Psychrobacter sp. I-STPA10 TaxID=2585769 RepID=UPI001E4A28B9|nr:low molecular weight protein-tyrosine-phosphatase [Psychrobacter sp. I-STPA10]